LTRTHSDARRQRLLTRALPLVLLALVSFVIGIVVAAGSSEKDAVQRFGDAWEQRDWDAMRAELTPASQEEYSAEDLQKSYEDAERIATATGLDVGEPRGPLTQDGDRVVALPVTVQTSAFGPVEGEIAVPVADGAIDWQPNLVFPGLGPDQELDRRTELPKRAPILAADRSPLAEGPAESRTTNGAGGIIAGEMGTAKGERAKELEARGFPKDAPTGATGLELAFDSQLAGTPGGQLLATGDGDPVVLAKREPTPGKPVRTTIDPKLQEATAAALGSSFGGAALLDARTGDVLALAGLAFSAPQPPGSTMKVITLTGTLEEGIAKPSDEFPVVSSATVGGREVANAHDELCGGTLTESFAKSCNSVFGPLGEQLGGKKLVDVSEKFGFNSPPTLYNQEAIDLVDPAESTIPHDLEDSMAGISAIGQGEVLATPLEMASVSQTIANKGVRSPNAIVKDPALAGDYPDVQVTSPAVAAQVTDMMKAVVTSGTGSAANISGVSVAGKTGTAELGTVDGQPIGTADTGADQDVDAWFTAFAPADNPKYAVAVALFQVKEDGGTVAAPIARAILEAAL
jgi:cell division protein FtsI/penicillin-binding protein 2